MKSYYVYILQCFEKSYYVGVTNNLDRRIQEHNQGIDENSYTYYRRPVKLVYYEEGGDIKDAIAREHEIKGWSRKKKEALINGDGNLLIQLSKSDKR